MDTKYIRIKKEYTFLDHIEYHIPCEQYKKTKKISFGEYPQRQVEKIIEHNTNIVSLK